MFNGRFKITNLYNIHWRDKASDKTFSEDEKEI